MGVLILVDTSLHGIRVEETTEFRAPTRPINTGVIGVVVTCSDELASKGYAYLKSRRQMELWFGTPSKENVGNAQRVLDAIYNHGNLEVIAIPVGVGGTPPPPPTKPDGDGAKESDKKEVSKADKSLIDKVVGSYTDDGATGIKALTIIATEPVGETPDGAPIFLPNAPKIIGAPDFSHDPEVLKALKEAGDKLKARVVVDSPNTSKEEATAFAATIGNDRVYPLYPKVVCIGHETSVGLSAPGLGTVAKANNEKGFHASPSSIIVEGVKKLTKPVSWSIDDPGSDANFLNNGKVATLIRLGSFRLHGNYSAFAEGSPIEFLCVRVTADTIADVITKNHYWALDKGITKSYIQTVVSNTKKYIDELKAEGAIIGGDCYADPEKNKPENIRKGVVVFTYKFTPVYPGNELVFESVLVDDYLTEIFNQEGA